MIPCLWSWGSYDNRKFSHFVRPEDALGFCMPAHGRGFSIPADKYQFTGYTPVHSVQFVRPVIQNIRDNGLIQKVCNNKKLLV